MKNLDKIPTTSLELAFQPAPQPTSKTTKAKKGTKAKTEHKISLLKLRE